LLCSSCFCRKPSSQTTIVVGVDGKKQIKNFASPLLCQIKTQFFMHRFLIVPSCPIPLLGWDRMKNLGVVLVMGHLLGLLMLQKGSKRVHKIPLKVDQQVSPPIWCHGVPRRAKTAITVKCIQLKDPNHYPSCSQYPLKQEA
jgi:hypothetical protein